MSSLWALCGLLQPLECQCRCSLTAGSAAGWFGLFFEGWPGTGTD